MGQRKDHRRQAGTDLPHACVYALTTLGFAVALLCAICVLLQLLLQLQLHRQSATPRRP